MKTIEELRAYLRARSVPLELWGTGSAKTIEHLLSELNSGESTLASEHGRLLKIGTGACLNIYHVENGRTLRLREEKQVFEDGREKVRADLLMSVGEKMVPGEDPIEAAYRALREELGITERLPLSPQPGFVKGPLPSTSFPGVYSQFHMYVFDVYLPDRWYKLEGYVEHQKDKNNYFVWDALPAEKALR